MRIEEGCSGLSQPTPQTSANLQADLRHDRQRDVRRQGWGAVHALGRLDEIGRRRAVDARDKLLRDRKSTRLNSSHGYISYAVFCLKKKTAWGSDLRRQRNRARRG